MPRARLNSCRCVLCQSAVRSVVNYWVMVDQFGFGNSWKFMESLCYGWVPPNYPNRWSIIDECWLLKSRFQKMQAQLKWKPSKWFKYPDFMFLLYFIHANTSNTSRIWTCCTCVYVNRCRKLVLSWWLFMFDLYLLTSSTWCNFFCHWKEADFNSYFIFLRELSHIIFLENVFSWITVWKYCSFTNFRLEFAPESFISTKFFISVLYYLVFCVLIRTFVLLSLLRNTIRN